MNDELAWALIIGLLIGVLVGILIVIAMLWAYQRWG